jgi:hypothetical protein
VKNNTITAAAGVLLLVAGSACAITISGLNSNSIASTTSQVADYSGVVQLTIVRPDLGRGMLEQCSGALLADGLSILTAADCVAGRGGLEQASSAYVTFHLPDGAYVANVARIHVDPLYNGAIQSANDIAVLTLSAPAPFTAARYELFESDAVGDTVTFAGYGMGGTGANGYDGALYPPGTLHLGENQYDAMSGSGDYLFDFDDGTVARDALGDGIGWMSEEAMIAPGDAGGPSFVDGEIAGVHSFVTRVLPTGGTVDIDGVLNSSFGEWGGDASVFTHMAFIRSAISPTPEPKTMFLVGMALVVVSLVGPKRPHR